MKGPHDEYCPVDWAREITELLPDAEYVPIPGTGHCSHISRPGAFNGTLADWFRRLRAREEEEREEEERAEEEVSVERGDA